MSFLFCLFITCTIDATIYSKRHAILHQEFTKIVFYLSNLFKFQCFLWRYFFYVMYTAWVKRDIFYFRLFFILILCLFFMHNVYFMYELRYNKWNVYFLFNFKEMMVDFPIATVYNLYIKDFRHCAIANRKTFQKHSDA